MFKNGGAEKFRRAAPQVFKIYFLSLGKRKPVRQLKKAGGILETASTNPDSYARGEDKDISIIKINNCE